MPGLAGPARLAALPMVKLGRTTVTVTGTGASKVSSTVTYSLAAKEVVLNVTANFAAANQITVSGLKMTGFTAVSGPASLGLITGGGDTGPIVATDDKIKTIAANLHNVAVSPHVTTANRLRNETPKPQVLA